MQTQRCDKRLILRHYTVKSYSYRYTLFREGGGTDGRSVQPPSFSLCPLFIHYTGVSFPFSGVNLTINIDLELGGLYSCHFPVSLEHAREYCIVFVFSRYYLPYTGICAARVFVEYALLLSGVFIYVELFSTRYLHTNHFADNTDANRLSVSR